MRGGVGFGGVAIVVVCLLGESSVGGGWEWLCVVTCIGIQY